MARKSGEERRRYNAGVKLLIRSAFEATLIVNGKKVEASRLFRKDGTHETVVTSLAESKPTLEDVHFLIEIVLNLLEQAIEEKA